MKNQHIKIGFWGGPAYSVMTLEKLQTAGFTISFVVTSLDRPKGRNLLLSESPAKIWARGHNIPVLQPKKLSDATFIEDIKKYNCDVFVVMAYGKIIPEKILEIPKGKSLNIHPSLLPKFRGPCPIESAILADEVDTGVTIMLMDKEMDHGPILAQKEIVVEPWPPFADDLGAKLVSKGADLLVSVLTDYLAGKMIPTEQDHSIATYTKKIQKEDGGIDLAGDPYQNYLKYKAYHGWPSVYFFKGGARIKITQASFVEGKFVIEKVIPEGKSEQTYTDLR